MQDVMTPSNWRDSDGIAVITSEKCHSLSCIPWLGLRLDKKELPYDFEDVMRRVRETD